MEKRGKRVWDKEQNSYVVDKKMDIDHRSMILNGYLGKKFYIGLKSETLHKFKDLFPCFGSYYIHDINNFSLRAAGFYMLMKWGRKKYKYVTMSDIYKVCTQDFITRREKEVLQIEDYIDHDFLIIHYNSKAVYQSNKIYKKATVITMTVPIIVNRFMKDLPTLFLTTEDVVEIKEVYKEYRESNQCRIIEGLFLDKELNSTRNVLGISKC